jgi:hypothetical protein
VMVERLFIAEVGMVVDIFMAAVTSSPSI